MLPVPDDVRTNENIGRIRMQRIALAAVLMLIGGTTALAQAPSWTPPPESARCPSKWGAGDERGAGNHMKPQTVLNALKLIKTGEAIELAWPLTAAMPFVGAPPRRFDVQLKRAVMNPAANERGSNKELFDTELGQVGTQLDGFAQQTHRDSLDNC